MKTLFRWLDPLFGLTLAAALAMVVISAWPGAALAADPPAGGGTATESRSVASFDALQTLGPDVLVRQASVQTATVQADRHRRLHPSARLHRPGQGRRLPSRSTTHDNSGSSSCESRRSDEFEEHR